ncbi:MAG TPA: zinc metallopeptidase [Thermotogota bacterium]|nr:zinc metallopeptidase [Thermotogota bacterium]HPJ88069.1 zinc metallopeptidase [Thermotogota bacterium]HPR96254.1 zinc metallopeptidase [Thermotogota bacterium]
MGFYTSMLVLIPAIIFGMWAQYKVKSTFEGYSKIRSKTGMTGSELARKLLDDNGLSAINVVKVGGNLTDHYDPGKRKVGLSNATYDSDSVAALGVVAHEIGHAIQHKNGYFPLTFRNAIAPVAQFGSQFCWVIFIAGIFLSMPVLIDVGIWLFVLVAIFSVITLPVEFNASSRALEMVRANIAMDAQETEMVRRVLTAAAMTYVASTLMAILQLIRMLMIRRD